MRITKTIPVGKFNVTISEITVKQSKELLVDIMGIAPQGTPSDNDFLHRHWGLFVEGITVEDLEDLYPSELSSIYEAFQEVNKVFFALAQSISAISPYLIWAKEQVEMFFSIKFALLSATDIPEPGTTDTATSSQS